MKRVKFWISGHFPENAWRKWPEILHADVSWPPSELISSWSRSVNKGKHTERRNGFVSSYYSLHFLSKYENNPQVFQRFTMIGLCQCKKSITRLVDTLIQGHDDEVNRWKSEIRSFRSQPASRQQLFNDGIKVPTFTIISELIFYPNNTSMA